MNLKLSKKLVLFIVVALVLLLMGLALELTDYGMSEKRVFGTKASLQLYRETIQQFKEKKDAYPETLKIATEFSKQQGQIIPKEVCEYITDAKGNNIQYEELNGNGGWYYDNNTGEVRVNVTNPIKNYLKLYFGKERNQIPSDW